MVQEARDYFDLLVSCHRAKDQEEHRAIETYRKECEVREKEKEEIQQAERDAERRNLRIRELQEANRASHAAMTDNWTENFATGADRLIDDETVLIYRDKCLRLRNDPDNRTAFRELIATISGQAEFTDSLSLSDLTTVVLDYITERAYQIENPDEEMEEDEEREEEDESNGN